jgi:hypothetical protein
MEFEDLASKTRDFFIELTELKVKTSNDKMLLKNQKKFVDTLETKMTE